MGPIGKPYTGHIIIYRAGWLRVLPRLAKQISGVQPPEFIMVLVLSSVEFSRWIGISTGPVSTTALVLLARVPSLPHGPLFTSTLIYSRAKPAHHSASQRVGGATKPEGTIERERAAILEGSYF